MSQSIDNSAAQSPKLLVATALITAVATIGAAFLGVVPHLYNTKTDDGQIAALMQQLEQLRKANLTNRNKNSTLDISGTVEAMQDGRPLTWGDVYLIPLQPTPQLSGGITKDGKFTFKGVPNERYIIIVRDADPKQLHYSLGQIDALENEAKLGDWLVKYKVDKGETGAIGDLANNTK